MVFSRKSKTGSAQTFQQALLYFSKRSESLKEVKVLLIM